MGNFQPAPHPRQPQRLTNQTGLSSLRKAKRIQRIKPGRIRAAQFKILTIIDQMITLFRYATGPRLAPGGGFFGGCLGAGVTSSG